MVKIETLIAEGKVVKIGELELARYTNFFENSYKENLEHSKAVMTAYPRWSIISGYYAMHDITKLLLAKNFMLKIELEAHATTIKVLAELIKNNELVKLIEKGYNEFIFLANDLASAKKERVKAQYYTGSKFMKGEYRKRASVFLNEVVTPFIDKIKALPGAEDD